MSKTRSPLTSFSAGLTGAVVLTAIHESVRQLLPDAPRMDVLGKRGILKLIRATNRDVPKNVELDRLTVYSDLASNALYFSLVGTGPGARRRGFILGLLAGIGAIALPEPLGLGKAPYADNPRTIWLTVLYYLTGGVIAGFVAHAASEESSASEHE